MSKESNRLTERIMTQRRFKEESKKTPPEKCGKLTILSSLNMTEISILPKERWTYGVSTGMMGRTEPPKKPTMH